MNPLPSPSTSSGIWSGDVAGQRDSSKIYYREVGWKYKLAYGFQIQTPIKPPKQIVTAFYSLTESGLLSLMPDYAWNGADCFPDIPQIMRGACVHDAFCQMMKERLLDYETYAPLVAEFIEQMCREDGMAGLLAEIVRTGTIVGRGGCPDDADAVPVILSAP